MSKFEFKDLAGQRFGRLTVVARAENGKGGRARWHVHCDCGNSNVVLADSLKSGKTKSCGCLKKKSGRQRVKDLMGQKFGRLIVVERADSSVQGNKKKAVWMCKCDCGRYVAVVSSKLISGHTRSCGCFQIARAREASRTHGRTRTRLYALWNNMKTRTSNPKCDMYHRYGGRGIKVCDEWKNNPTAFMDYALSIGYRDNLSIDRIDNDGNYEPGNIRFVGNKTQANNKSNSRRLTVGGKTRTIAEWSRVVGVKYATLQNRVAKGWTSERALGLEVAA